jgi:hypothetical protein
MKSLKAHSFSISALLLMTFSMHGVRAAPEVSINTQVISGGVSDPMPYNPLEPFWHTTIFAADGTSLYGIVTAIDSVPITGAMSIEVTVQRGTQILKHYTDAPSLLASGEWVAPGNCKPGRSSSAACNLEMAKLHTGEPVTITAIASDSNGTSKAAVTYLIMGAKLTPGALTVNQGGFTTLTWASNNAKFATLQALGNPSKPISVGLVDSTNVGLAASTTYRLVVAAAKIDLANPCNTTPRTVCADATINVNPVKATPPPGKIWIEPIYMWDNIALRLSFASAHYSGRYVATTATSCPVPERITDPLAFDATIGPLDVGPVGVQNPARIPMQGVDIYAAEVQPGTICVYAYSPEVNLSRVCRKNWAVGTPSPTQLNTLMPPSSPDCG